MTKSKLPPYSIIEVPIFDARSGLNRCSLPGVGASVDGYPKGNAGFWWSPTGSIMLKTRVLKSQYAFEARLASGQPISERSLSDFGWYVSDQLLRWATQIDDVPFEEASFPNVVMPVKDVDWLSRLLVTCLETGNTDPEVLAELLPELGGIRVMRKIADADSFYERFDLLMKQIGKSKAKAERSLRSEQNAEVKVPVRRVVKRLAGVEAKLADFLVNAGSPQSPLKKIEMSESESLMWDNDPFALPKSADSKLAVMEAVYRRMLDRGVNPESEEAKRFSAGEPQTYADWLAKRTQGVNSQPSQF